MDQLSGSKAIPLTEFHERVYAWADENFDVRADSKDMLFHDEADIETFGTEAMQNEVSPAVALFGHPTADELYNSERMTLDDNAKAQIAERFNLPNRYMWDDKYFDSHLRKLNFEHKFRIQPQDNMLIRGRHLIEGDRDGDICRAVLTKHYRPFDNDEFIDAIMEAVTTKGVDPDTCKVGKWQVGSDMHGFLILPNIQFDRQNGRPPTADGGGSGGLHPGAKFSNSEVGRRRTRIDGGGWRGYCENGMIFGWQENTSFAMVHRGQRVMSLMVNEALADALQLSEEGSLKFMEKMALKVERTDIGQIVNDWSTKYGFSVASTEAWTSLVTADSYRGEISEFDVINSLTYVARDLDNMEEAEKLQIAAGEMVFANTVERGLRVPR